MYFSISPITAKHKGMAPIKIIWWKETVCYYTLESQFWMKRMSDHMLFSVWAM